MLKEFYEVLAVPSGAKLFTLLDHFLPDLILLDVDMPEMNGYDAIEKLKADTRFASIPVIFVTAMDDENSELMGLRLGAIDYVTKPFSAPLLLKRIENHLLMVRQREELIAFNNNLKEMVYEKTCQVTKLENSVLSTVAEMVEFRDEVTGNHLDRTQQYLKLLIDQMVADGCYADKISEWDFSFLLPSAQLHDVGKIAISDVILNKPGKLTAEEFNIMKRHTTIGVDIIRRIEANTPENDFLYYAEIFAGTHHEKWDGSGYPNGLCGENIPLQGRIMAIVDVYDALISVRPYKDPIPPDQARTIIEAGKASHFDPALVDVFFKVEDRFANIASEYQASLGKERKLI
jgi:putative two-component system response regulator